MIIRSGWGILIPVVYIVPFGLSFLLFGILTGKTQNPYFIQLGILVGAIVGFLALYKLHQYRQQQSGKEMIDKVTGQELIYRKSHTFFFMGTKIWLYILGAISAIAIIGGVITMITVFMNS